MRKEIKAQVKNQKERKLKDYLNKKPEKYEIWKTEGK